MIDHLGKHELDDFLLVAVESAKAAGELLIANMDMALDIRFKQGNQYDPSSRIDVASEAIIIEKIRSVYPDHGLLSEEVGEVNPSAEFVWIIDPLDGTVNYIHGRRYFCISIAVRWRQEIILGVVFNPITNELFTAQKGNGTYLNEEKTAVSKIIKLAMSLLAMGFPYERDSSAFKLSTDIFVKLVEKSQAIRRDGSTALALCNVACGRYDGFCVAGNELWDYAAGSLIVAEAGGTVTNFHGKPLVWYGPKNEVVASNSLIHADLLNQLSAN
jgi:myo-inositol-1(or 4)-monophosphatase